MDTLCNNDVDLISLHINNYLRPSLDFASPFMIASLMLNKKVMTLNNLYQLTLDKVILKPSLLKKED